MSVKESLKNAPYARGFLQAAGLNCVDRSQYGRFVEPQPITHHNTGWALLLDVDGTLLEIAATPHDVYVSERLKQLLNQAHARLEGALALVSGRNLASLDALFAPARYCAAGLHGFERRDAAGRIHAPFIDAAGLAPARCALQAFVAAHEGLLLEDKGHGVAVHFRQAPHMSDATHRAATKILEELGSEFVLQQGKCVVELRPRACNKGTAVAAFMHEPPFRGRTPIYVGDDLTDEDAFAAVNELNGVSVRVGAPGATLARYRLADVAAVIDWLAAVVRDVNALGGLAARVEANQPAGR